MRIPTVFWSLGAGSQRTVLVAGLIFGSLISCARSPERVAAGYLASGKRFVEKQDHGAAILQFRNAGELQPSNPEILYSLGLSYAATGNAHEAIQALLQATQADGKHLPSQVKLAELMVSASDNTWVKQGRERAARILALHTGHPGAIYVLAVADARAGNWKAAESGLRNLLSSHPADVPATVALATVLHATKKSAAAEDILRSALRTAVTNPQLRTTLGKLYRSTGRLAEAEAELLQVLQHDPKNIQALVELADVQNQNGRAQQAETTYKQVATLSPNIHWQLYPEFLMQQGKFDAAVVELRRLSEGHANNGEMRASLVRALLANNQAANANTLLHAALPDDSKDVGVRLQRAQLYVTLGNYQEAEQDITRILGYQYHSAEAHYVLAEIHSFRGETLLQRRQLEEAVRFRPDFLQARVELARVLIKTGRARAALDLMAEAPSSQMNLLAVISQRNWALLAVRDLPGFSRGVADGLAQGETPELLLQQGVLRLMKNDGLGARSSLDRSVDREPDATSAGNALEPKPAEVKRSRLLRSPPTDAVGLILAMTEEAAGHSRSAIDHYRKVIKADPNNIVALNNLAYLLAERNDDLDNALIYAQHAQRLAPENGITDDTLGWVLYRKHFYAAAIQHLERAVSKHGTARFRYHLAMAYAKSGSAAQARASLSLAIKLNPAFPEAEMARKVLTDNKKVGDIK